MHLKKIFILEFIFIMVAAVMLYAAMASYLQHVGQQMLSSWLVTESVALQEGNLLSAISRQGRMVTSSQVVSTLVVRQGENILAEFGDTVDFERDVILNELKPDSAKHLGFFYVVVSQPLSDEMTVMFFLKSNTLSSIYLLVVFLLLTIFGILNYLHHMRLGLQKKYYESEALRRSISNDFTKLLAHDLRAPFSLVKQCLVVLDYFQVQASQEHDFKKLKDEMNSAAVRADALMNDALVFDAPNALQLEPVTISDLVAELKEIHKNLNVCDDYRNISIKIDKIKLVRVFDNIIRNAFEAGAKDVSLSILLNKHHVVIAIENFGTFIPPAILKRIFEPYMTHNKVNGTGLGLAIAEKFVLAHHGKISCSSQKNMKFPDGFTSFHVELPLKKEA